MPADHAGISAIMKGNEGEEGMKKREDEVARSDGSWGIVGSQVGGDLRERQRGQHLFVLTDLEDFEGILLKEKELSLRAKALYDMLPSIEVTSPLV